MHPSQKPIPDLLVEAPHHIGVRSGSTDIVPCCKEVAGIEADPDSGFVFDEGDYGGEVVEGGSDDVGVCIGLGT